MNDIKLKKSRNGYWNNYETCEKESLNYKTRSEFKNCSYTAWKYSSNNKWLDDFYPIIIKNTTILEDFNNYNKKHNHNLNVSNLKITDFTNYKKFKKEYNSLYDFINDIYPGKYKCWELYKVENGFWEDENNVIEYLKWFEEELNIKCEADWYNIKRDEFREYNGYGLYKIKFKQKLINICKFLYPAYDWKEWFFVKTVKDFWQDENNVIKYLKWLEEELNINCEEDWYKIDTNDIKQYSNIHGILNEKFNSSIYNISNYLYSSYDFKFWLFKNPYNNSWQDENNVIEYLKWLEEELNINCEEDWYNVSIKDVCEKKGIGVFRYSKEKSIYSIVKILYPNYKWKKESFLSNYKRQQIIASYIRSKYDGELIYNYKHDKIIYDSGKKGELDIFLPEKNIAIEVNGIQHYEYHSFFHKNENDFTNQQKRDIYKKLICDELNILLVNIKFDDPIDEIYKKMDYIIEN